MRIFRLQCLLFATVAGVLVLSVGYAGAQVQILPSAPRWHDDPPAQTQIAQPTSWCLRWTDTCTNCEHLGHGDEIRCTVSWHGRAPGCVAGAPRCVMADDAALKDACEQARTTREDCNKCTPGGACTAKGCLVQEIVCVKPRT